MSLDPLGLTGNAPGGLRLVRLELLRCLQQAPPWCRRVSPGLALVTGRFFLSHAARGAAKISRGMEVGKCGSHVEHNETHVLRSGRREVPPPALLAASREHMSDQKVRGLEARICWECLSLSPSNAQHPVHMIRWENWFGSGGLCAVTL